MLRPASWPEALQVAADGLKKAGDSVGVLTGGRLTVQDAYGYSKFARAVLGTNNIDFRSRPHTAEEAEFLAHAIAGSAARPGAAPVTFADLETAVRRAAGLRSRPRRRPATIFLRLRKANRKTGLKSWTLAPYLSNGARKHGATLIKTVPGAEAATLNQLPAGVQLDADSVILVGERAALSSGTLTAVLALSRSTGARIAWIPRRAGDRGAVEAGCLPNLLPGGRPISDASARVDLASAWGITERARRWKVATPTRC